jgi:hypothetical protein
MEKTWMPGTSPGMTAEYDAGTYAALSTFNTPLRI